MSATVSLRSPPTKSIHSPKSQQKMWLTLLSSRRNHDTGVTGTLLPITDKQFKRGKIPEEYWDETLTPTPAQLTIIAHLINTKYFNDNTPHPAIQSDFQFAMDALDSLGDTRWVSAEDFIHSLIQLPNMEDFK